LWTLLVLVALAGPAVHAQNATLRGLISEAQSGQAVIGANVAVWPPGSPDRLRGAAADVNGIYAVVGLAPGRYVVRVTAVGYEAAFDTLALAAGTRQYDVDLRPVSRQLGEATVQSERVSGSANVEAGFQRIQMEDIQVIPAPDVSGDLVNYLVSLPGIVTSGDRGGQLFVRGGDPSQNGVYLDGIPVFQPFHVLGFYSAFPADLVQTADVYAGGFDSRFGSHLASILDVTARTGNLDHFETTASVAPFVAAASAEGPIVKDRLSVLASGRISTVEQLAARYVDAPLPFAFSDVLGKVFYAPSSTSRLSVTGLATYDRGGIGEPDSRRADEISYRNRALGLRYVLLPSEAPFLARVQVSYSDLRATLGSSVAQAEQQASQDERLSDLARFNAEFDLVNLFKNADLRYGGFLRRTLTSSSLDGLFQNVESSRLEALEVGLYAQPEVRWRGFMLSPGVRWTFTLGLLEPRLRASWEGGPHRLSVAAGLYNQPVVGLSDRRDATSVFTAWTVAPSDATPRASHVVGGYRLRPTAWADVSVEGFYKDLRELSIAEWTGVPRLTTALQSADGEAYGMDLRAEVRPGRALVLLNYGLSYVTYLSTSARNEIWYGDEALVFRPAHDRRHQATVAASIPFAGFTGSLRWQFGSGLPYSQALGFDQFIVLDGVPDLLTDAGQSRVIYARPFNAVLPTYHRLDATLDRDFRIGPGMLTAQVGLLNAYDRRNLFALDIFTLERVDQLPVIPTLGLRYVAR
jgi:hypothetical protein